MYSLLLTSNIASFSCNCYNKLLTLIELISLCRNASSSFICLFIAVTFELQVCEKDSNAMNKEDFNTVCGSDCLCKTWKEQNNESSTGKTRTIGRTIAVDTYWGLARKGVLVF